MSSRTKKIIQLAADQTAAATNESNMEWINTEPIQYHYDLVENVIIETVDTTQTADLSLSLLENYDFMIPMSNSALEDVMIKGKDENRSVDEAQNITTTQEETVENKSEDIVEKQSEKISEDKIQIATNTNSLQEIIEPENNNIDTSNNNQTTSSLEISATSSDPASKLVDYSSTDSDEMPTKNNKRKKRFQVQKAAWYGEKNKIRRERGKRYFGRAKINGNWNYDIERQPKQIKERCTCKTKKNGVLKCELVSDEKRKYMFDYFWTLNWGEKKLYVDNTVKSSPVARPRDRKDAQTSRRNQTFIYYLKIKEEEIRVCRKMYLNTLGLGRMSVQKWKQKLGSFDNSVENFNSDGAIKPSAYRQQQNEKKKPFIKENENLTEFLDSLPTMESHYCRSSSSKNYLLPEWTSKEELYRFYKTDGCQTKNIKFLSFTSFNKAFESKNMALFRPKKDECEICEKFKNGFIGEEQYNAHIVRKNEARAEKQKDVKNEKYVFTVDLQAVLMSPKSNISSLYYKTKLCVHNLCFYNLLNKDGYCYLWHEGEGGLNAEEFSSCFYSFLETKVIPTMDKAERKIVMWSDGCTYQNRNVTLANAALNLCKKYDITIEHKYLEVGHTQMQVDSMHATIERRVKSVRINVPADYAYHCKKARKNPKPYDVMYLDHSFFRSFKKVEAVRSIRPGKKPGDPKVLKKFK